MMRKPYPDSPFARLLALLYAKAVSVRNACFDHAPGASMAFNTPVISVGGIHAGGTGKTPLSILIGQYYSRKGIQVACLSRGYRRQSRRRIIVTPGETVSWERIGDEPAMIRREIPECLLGIGADRCATLAALQDRLRPPSAVILDDGFQYRPDEIRQKISPGTKAVFINSPSNPTGNLLSEKRMKAIAEFSPFIISDEIYHGLVYEGRAHSILEFTENCFVLNGFSKLYAMTGLRLGYIIAPRPFIRPMQKIQQNFFISANSGSDN